MLSIKTFEKKANYRSVEILLVSLLQVHFVPCRGGEDPAFHQQQEPSGQISDPEHQQLLDRDLEELRNCLKILFVREILQSHFSFSTEQNQYYRYTNQVNKWSETTSSSTSCLHWWTTLVHHRASRFSHHGSSSHVMRASHVWGSHMHGRPLMLRRASNVTTPVREQEAK